MSKNRLLALGLIAGGLALAGLAGDGRSAEETASLASRPTCGTTAEDGLPSWGARSPSRRDRSFPTRAATSEARK